MEEKEIIIDIPDFLEDEIEVDDDMVDTTKDDEEVNED